MKDKIRVRFAPSPTGPLHIGGVRTALYNYLFAKKYDGDLILRIEDTDQNRYVKNSEPYILESLQWCGINFDEGPHVGGPYGPYRQSERKPRYRAYAEQLIKKGSAYYAFDTPEELDALREKKEKNGDAFSYNWENRDQLRNSLGMSDAEIQKALAEESEYVIRFKSPKDERLVLKDLIRGDIEIDSNILDDKVLFKSDGMPTYHLANIVDDHEMKISHVIRGEEWLPSLALHFLLYRAFDWKPPQFAHLPLIMKPTGKGKLSKRDGEKMGFPVYPLRWDTSPGYRDSGYFPEAVVNFLALLGWNPGTEQEVFTMPELVEAFTIDRVHKAGARFDPEKTKWYNHQHLQRKTTPELARLFRPLVEGKLRELQTLTGRSEPMPDLAYIEKTVDLLKERATFIADLWKDGTYFYAPPRTFHPKAVQKHWKEGTASRMQNLVEFLEGVNPFTSRNLEEQLKSWIDNTEGLSFGNTIPPLRLLLVGDLMGPHIFDIMDLLGRQACIDRIRNGIGQLQK